MSFDSLLGNERLKENLTGSLRRGRISHFYLISGPAGSGKKTLARLLAAAVLCQNGGAPCFQCTACRKVMADTHPDFITVLDPEHKTVAVKLVRQIREDMFIRPNEADRKIYLFPQELGIEGQNALLKILEEPPEYGVFLLLTDNPEKILPTVRSRCTELALQSLPENILRQALQKEFPDQNRESVDAAIFRSGGWLGQAKQLLSEGSVRSAQTEAFAKSFTSGDTMGLLQALVPMEKWKRDQLIPELTGWLELLQQALTCRCGMPSATQEARELASQRSSRDLHKAIQNLQKAIEYAQGNVSPAAVCGWLEWALR